MHAERYELEAGSLLNSFEFYSEGPKGRISNMVKFDETMVKGVFNLAFGDKDDGAMALNDCVVSDNKDRVTVVASIYAFTKQHPMAWMYAARSSAARNRLCRMGIIKYLSDIQSDFGIYGQIDDAWAFFKKAGISMLLSSGEKWLNPCYESERF